MDLLGQVAQWIERQALLDAGQAVLVGVSGGADSLCALDCLHRLGYRCVVAHLDHGLRPTSAREAEQVGELAAGLGLAFASRRVELAEADGSLEEAARLARYRFLASLAHSHEVDTIAVGHTADDQAETVLMHLLRGAGPGGLRGMLPATSLDDWVGVPEGAGLTLIRPLLEVRRSDTQAHCAARGLQPIVDESNLDRTFFRNRLRHELLPELASYNPRIRRVLTRTAKVMAAEAALIEQLVDRGWPEWVREAGAGALALQRSTLAQAPLALQRAALRRAVQHLRPELRDIGFDSVEQVVQDLAGADGLRRTIVGGLEVVPLDDELVIREPGAQVTFPDLPQLVGDRAEQLTVPGEIELAQGWRLLAEPAPDPGQHPRSRYEALVDPAQQPGELQVRAPQPGDRIKPLGMRGTMKLSDLFVNRKVPWLARERWPLLCAGSEILWVVGLHVSRRAVPSGSTAVVARVRAIGPDAAD